MLTTRVAAFQGCGPYKHSVDAVTCALKPTVNQVYLPKRRVTKRLRDEMLSTLDREAAEY